MSEGVYGFFERYGWYCLVGAGLCFFIYQKFLYDRVQEMYANREVAHQKKYDETQDQRYRQQMETARARMQEEYAKESERVAELEKQKAQQRKNLKLGLTEPQEAAKEPKQAVGGFNAMDFVKRQIAARPVVIFSKSWCPYSRKAKEYLIDVNRLHSLSYLVIELDEHSHGDAIQSALQEITGGRSVPRVFIGGKFIGGGDDTERLHNNGQLAGLLQKAEAHFD